MSKNHSLWTSLWWHFVSIWHGHDEKRASEEMSELGGKILGNYWISFCQYSLFCQIYLKSYLHVVSRACVMKSEIYAMEINWWNINKKIRVLKVNKGNFHSASEITLWVATSINHNQIDVFNRNHKRYWQISSKINPLRFLRRMLLLWCKFSNSFHLQPTTSLKIYLISFVNL